MRSLVAVALVSLLSVPSCTASSGKAGAGQAGTNDGNPAVSNPKLLEPFDAIEKAPELYKVKLETTRGAVVLEIHRDWAPRGADRFYNLVKLGYFEEIGFFRAIDKFMVQFGIHGNPTVSSAWKTAPIKDDPRTQPNARGTISFANRGPDTRTTQVFINYTDHPQLDQMGFAPFGKVVEGMDVIDSLYTGYGEGAPQGTGPNQRNIEREGNAYLKKRFPKLDWLTKAALVEG